MDRVQLADTSPWKGMPYMSDTDNTYATTARASRPTALGDLRFAGTIAAGLVAGTLGLGALAAPLVGWKDWPSGLEKDAATATVQLPSAKQQPPARTAQGTGARIGGGQLPGGATPLTQIGLPGGVGLGLGAGVGTAGGPGAAGTPGAFAVLVANGGSAGATTPSTGAGGNRRATLDQ